jgi:hypothetical protein
MSLYIEDLIMEVRDHTENNDVSDTVGINDSEFVRYLNDGQYRIHSLVVQTHNNAFLGEKDIDVVSKQEEYAFPNDIYLNGRITQIMYRHTSNEYDFYPLKPMHLINRRPGIVGRPNRYVRKHASFLINPLPSGSSSGAKLRVNYTREIPRLDKRRAVVGSVTLGTSDITALSFNVSSETIDSEALLKRSTFTIVDKNGIIKMKNIPYDAISTVTGVVTITSGFEFESGETITVGDYVCSGKNSTTHSELPQSIERYLIAYADFKVLKRDSSVDSTEALQELSEMESEIVSAYADILDDIYEVPLINDDIDGFGWF